MIFSEFDTPVKITQVIYPVCLPEVAIDPKHLTGELTYELIFFHQIIRKHTILV